MLFRSVDDMTKLGVELSECWLVRLTLLLLRRLLMLYSANPEDRAEAGAPWREWRWVDENDAAGSPVLGIGTSDGRRLERRDSISE